MNRRAFLQRTFLAGVSAATAVSAAPAKRPNILFVMTDDQGPWSWGDGHPDARTPYIDRLRAEGVHLANYFASCPVCSPARASMLTSRYPLEFGFADYLPESLDPTAGLDPSFPVWPRELQRAGYRTGHVGKWHVGDSDRSHPTQLGYDYFAGWRHGARTSKDPVMEIEGAQRPMKGFTPDILTDLALDFMGKGGDPPFLLSLHFWAPHANTANKTPDGDRTWLPVSDGDWDLFKDITPTLPEPRHPDLDVPRAERMTREYLASVHSVDRNLGRVLAALEANGQADNTIVIYTSDHGFNMAHHGIWHKGNGRWLLKNDQGNRANLWDNSLRAPAFIRWPGKITAGSTVTRTTSCLDWFPSLLSMAGVPHPEGVVLRGQDMAPLLRGETPAWNDDFFIQYDQRASLPGSANMRGYRTPEWKLVRDFRNAGKDELYHLTEDPGELENLIASEDGVVKEVVLRLDAKLKGMMVAVDDPLLEGSDSRAK